MSPRDDLSDSVLWSALRNMLTELTSTQEIAMNTDPAYVISYICRELRAKNLVTQAGLRPRAAEPPT
jgi:hypothetical protein